MICRANQLTGFYMMATLAFNELKSVTLNVNILKNCANMKQPKLHFCQK